MQNEISIVHDSVRRADRDPAFLKRFYDLFTGSSPEIAEKFADTDMVRQRRALEASLYTSLLAIDGVEWAATALVELGRRHQALGITEAQFDLWIDSLVAVVGEFDDEYSDEVGEAWRAVLAASVDVMLGR